jgi:hypothetical protein
MVLVALPTLDRYGAFRPQVKGVYLGWGGQFFDENGPRLALMLGGPIPNNVSDSVTIVNKGWSTLRILEVAVAGSGFTFDHATVGDADVEGDTVHPGGRTLTSQSPVTLAPGDTLAIRLYLTITNCKAVAPAGQRASIRISSWRGTQTVSVPLSTVRHNENAGWTVTTPNDPHGISSVRYLADGVCQTYTRR